MVFYDCHVHQTKLILCTKMVNSGECIAKSKKIDNKMGEVLILSYLSHFTNMREDLGTQER